MEDQLNEDQVAQIEGVFASFDKDGDGTIAIKDFSGILRALDQNPTESEIQHMIEEASLDYSDGKGRIDFPDFLRMMAKRMRTSSDK